MIAAPRMQTNHKFIDRAVDQWLDIHFGDHSFNGRVFIGHRKRGGGIYTMAVRSLVDLRQYVMLIHASQRMDYYITANSVSGTSRNLSGLFGLQNIVIDVDCHEDDADVVALVQAFLWRADRDLWGTGELPRPNSIVRTGRGVQLWWAIKPCHASCRKHYNNVKTGIMDRISVMLGEYGEELNGLDIDRGASSNAVGYFRMPCTYNTAAKKYGSLQILHEERYDLHDLAHITPLPESALPKVPEKAVPMQKCDLIVLHNAYSTGANRVLQLIKLRNFRNNDVGAETRNNLCFSVYNALRMSFDHEEAMMRLRAYNDGFKQPMTEKELEHTICSAKAKNGYKYTNAKLIEFLEITQEEQDAIGLHPFTGKYRPWSHAKPNATRDAVRKARREDRDGKIISMHREGVSQAETARTLGISRNTVARVIRDWKEEVAQKDLEVAQENLLNYGSINDCLLATAVPDDAFVSLEDGHSPAIPARGLLSIPINTKDMPDGS